MIRYFLLIGLLGTLLSLAQAESNFSVYVTNNSPYIIQLNKTHYSETELNFSAHEVMPYVQQFKVAEGVTENERASISFYAQVGMNEDYWNTPIIMYQFSAFVKQDSVEPQQLMIDEKKYQAFILFNQDKNPNSIVLKIDIL